MRLLQARRQRTRLSDGHASLVFLGCSGETRILVGWKIATIDSGEFQIIRKLFVARNPVAVSGGLFRFHLAQHISFSPEEMKHLHLSAARSRIAARRNGGGQIGARAKTVFARVVLLRFKEHRRNDLQEEKNVTMKKSSFLCVCLSALLFAAK